MTPVLAGYAPISQVHAQILQDLGLDKSTETSDTDKWYRWIVQFQVDYQLPIAFAEMISDIPISSCQAPKPFGFTRLLDIHILNVPGVPQAITPRIKTISDRSVYGPRTPKSDRLNTLSYEVAERDWYFETSSNADGATLHLRYQAIYLAEDGLPVVDMSYYDAIRAYAYLQYAMTMVGQNKQGWENKHAYAYAEFQRQRRKCRNPIGRMSAQQYNQITAMWADPRYATQNPEFAKEQNINTYHAFRGITTSTIRLYSGSYAALL